MEYKGSRLKKFVGERSGAYTELEKKMRKYRKARKNSSDAEYNLRPLYKDGHNITISVLTALMRETGKSLDFFIDFEPNEIPSTLRSDNVSGNHNVINSNISNDSSLRIEYLTNTIKLKDQLIDEKERNIIQKDSEIAALRKQNNKLIEMLEKLK